MHKNLWQILKTVPFLRQKFQNFFRRPLHVIAYDNLLPFNDDMVFVLCSSAPVEKREANRGMGKQRAVLMHTTP